MHRFRLALCAPLVLAAACAQQSGLFCSSDDQCDPSDACIAGQCTPNGDALSASAIITATPSSQTRSASVGVAPAPASVTLTNSDSVNHPVHLACSGAGASPAQSTVTLAPGGSGVAAIDLAAPTAAGAQTATCTGKSSTGKTTWVTFTITVDATNGSGGGSGGGHAGGSGGGSGGGSAGGSGGGSGGIGVTGGSVDHLYFAVVGDSRPANIDQTSSYPTAIIGKIYAEIEALDPRPQFVVSTGDYMYANTNTDTAQPQMNLYLAARDAFSGPLFAAMGNHECDGYTADNCAVNQTQNNQAFMSSLMAPLGQTNPYYRINFSGTDGSWNAKLLVVACNAWSSTQQAWLTAQLAQSTTYTFLARHEPKSANTGPCVSSVESLMSKSTYDLSLVGHSHEFALSGKEITVGNGGAPLASGAGNYGFTTIERVGTSWTVKSYDYSTGMVVKTYTVQ